MGHIRRSALHALTGALLILVSLPAEVRADDKQPAEYEVKAALLYNFMKFVEWPDSPFPHGNSAIAFCILGENPFGKSLALLEAKSIKGKTIKVHEMRDLKEAACHILFISASQKEKLPQILEAVRGQHILTVSDTEGFAQQGVMINMYTETNKVRFEINLSAAESDGIKISSRLLRLARIVPNRHETGERP